MGTRLVPMCCVTFFFFFLLFANHPHAVTWPSMCSLPPRRCPLRCFKGLVKGLRAHNRAKNLCVLGVPKFWIPIYAYKIHAEILFAVLTTYRYIGTYNVSIAYYYKRLLKTLGTM